MKPILLTLIFLFICSVIHGQEAGKKTSGITPEIAIRYYNIVNKAELAICDSNFEQAARYYKEAFTINPSKPFSKDLSNAFFAVMDTRDFETSEKYLKQLLKRGIGAAYIERTKDYYKGESLEHINAVLSKYPNDTIKKNPMVAQIHEMVQWDQDVRNYFYELNNGRYMVDSTFTVDDINSKALLKLFKEKGFPNENVLGSNAWQNYNPNVAPEYDLIILHNTGAAMGRRSGHIFDTILYRAVMNLDYHPRWFGEVVQKTVSAPWFKYDGVTLNFPITISGCFYKNIIYPEYYDEVSEKKINTERAKIGLETLDEFRRKLEVANKVKTGNTVLSKYSMGTDITVMDVNTEDELHKWLEQKGGNAVVKPTISGFKYTPIVPAAFDIGQLGDWFVMGEPVYDTLIRWYKNIHPDWYMGKIAFKNWKNRIPPLKWGYHAEVIQNYAEDLSTDTGRYNYARFIQGYKMLIQNGWWFWFGNLDHLEQLFDDKGTLISFAANVDTVFYKTMTKYVCPPTSYNEKCDTVPYPLDNNYSVILKKRTYAWIKGNSKTEIVLTDNMDEKGRKKTRAVCYMYHIEKYTAYLQKVDAEKKKLDAEYSSRKK